MAEALVIDSHNEWSHSETWDLANRLAHLIREATADPSGHRRVAVFSENCAEAVICHLGALRSGASCVAINSHLRAPEVAYQLKTGEVSLVLAGVQTLERAIAAASLVEGCEVRSWSEPTWPEWIASAPSGPPSDTVAIPPNLLFTSGTTGTPKATELPPNVFPVRESWAEFVNAARANRFSGLGRHLVVAPLHHTGPLNAVRALAADTPVAILERFDPTATLNAIQQWSIASTTLVPTHLQRILALPQSTRDSFDVASLKLVFLTGAACPVDVKREIIKWWGPVVLEAYGATEVGVTCSISSADWLTHPGSVGKSVAPYSALVVDDDETEVPVGTEGRLYFRDSTGRGIIYEGDPERTAAAHLSPGVFTLGEIGRIDDEGFVYITDRFSDMVVSGGVNVYPAEMEKVLIEHPDVADVAGIGLPDDDLGERLVALVVLTTPSTQKGRSTLEDLQEWCEARLSRFKCPREIVAVEDLGRNALGKLDKRKLRTEHSEGPAIST